MIFLREANAAVVLVTLTLSLQCAGMAALISFAKSSIRRSQTRADPFRSAHGAIDDCVHCLAHIRDSALGRVLSLALFSIMGICLLLFDKQLCHRRLWRYRSPADVADLGSGGKHHRRADVRVVREFPVRHCDPARRARSAALRRTREALTCGEFCAERGWCSAKLN